MSTYFLLIRHGETAWNKEFRLQGQMDIPLSPVGEEQARRLKARLRSLPLHAAFSSDLSRARRTAEIALDGRTVPFSTSEALRERHFGLWQGLNWDEIRRDFPREFEASEKDGVTLAVPGGETWERLRARVAAEMDRLARENDGKTVAAFTHGGTCKMAVFAALDLPAAQWRAWRTDNASITRLVREDDGRWKLAGFNDTAHLEDLVSKTDTSSD